MLETAKFGKQHSSFPTILSSSAPYSLKVRFNSSDSMNDTRVILRYSTVHLVQFSSKGSKPNQNFIDLWKLRIYPLVHVALHHNLKSLNIYGIDHNYWFRCSLDVMNTRRVISTLARSSPILQKVRNHHGKDILFVIRLSIANEVQCLAGHSRAS